MMISQQGAWLLYTRKALASAPSSTEIRHGATCTSWRQENQELKIILSQTVSVRTEKINDVNQYRKQNNEQINEAAVDMCRELRKAQSDRNGQITCFPLVFKYFF